MASAAYPHSRHDHARAVVSSFFGSWICEENSPAAGRYGRRRRSRTRRVDVRRLGRVVRGDHLHRRRGDGVELRGDQRRASSVQRAFDRDTFVFSMLVAAKGWHDTAWTRACECSIKFGTFYEFVFRAGDSASAEADSRLLDASRALPRCDPQQSGRPRRAVARSEVLLGRTLARAPADANLLVHTRVGLDNVLLENVLACKRGRRRMRARDGGEGGARGGE